jgi:hypothetical protein
MIAGCSSGGAENFDQFDGFHLQLGNLLRRNQGRPFGDFNPEIRFVSFFQNSGNFADEIRVRFPAKCSAIIRRHRTATARHLTGYGSARRLGWKRVGKFKNPDSESNGPFFKFGWVHICSGIGLMKKSSIINGFRVVDPLWLRPGATRAWPRRPWYHVPPYIDRISSGGRHPPGPGRRAFSPHQVCSW